MFADTSMALEKMESETSQLNMQLAAANEQISTLRTEKDELEAMVNEEVRF